jgi:hypothetical protein
MQAWRERYLREGLADSRKRWFRSPVLVGKAESPVVDVSTTPIPLVCPGKHESPGTASRKRCTDLPVKHPRLGLRTVAQAVQPDLTHEQRAVAGDVLQARKVGLIALLCLQIDIKAH